MVPAWLVGENDHNVGLVFILDQMEPTPFSQGFEEFSVRFRPSAVIDYGGRLCAGKPGRQRGLLCNQGLTECENGDKEQNRVEILEHEEMIGAIDWGREAKEKRRFPMTLGIDLRPVIHG